ncbi:unnamed protein product [Fusarium graminearum]|uniref:Chromosome 4, complete genome n=1 Tax=Gibberella zeae (strain ATCC MYA-4620 / CBS 123657 / FGSC 9075 / NRRL 31084 / PH-1) TaxID=229533 RepID=A0A098DX52_GIBZE|nr:unnamed protein product [Fusarium graminearum]
MVASNARKRRTEKAMGTVKLISLCKDRMSTAFVDMRGLKKLQIDSRHKNK